MVLALQRPSFFMYVFHSTGKAMLACTLWHITCDFVSHCRPVTSRRRAFSAIVIDCLYRVGDARRVPPRPTPAAHARYVAGSSPVRGDVAFQGEEPRFLATAYTRV